MQEFKLHEGECIELHNLLKVMGLCDSGGIAKTVIAQGQVRVDGRIELRKRCKIRSGQMIEFEGRCVTVKK
jgi:ribosome-associated protein